MIVMKAGRRKWWVQQLAFSPDGTVVAAPAGMHGVYLLPAFGTSEVVDPLPLPSYHAGRVCFSPDGSFLLSEGAELVTVALPSRAATTVARSGWGHLLACVSADGSRVIVGEMLQLTGPSGLRSRYTCRAAARPADVLWQVEFDGVVRSELLVPADGDRFLSAEWRPAGTQHLYWRSTETGEVIAEGPYGNWSVAALSSDGRWAAWTHGRRVFVRHTPGTPPLAAEVKNDGRREFTGVAFHPSGRYLAATSNDQTVKLYDTQTWAVAKAYSWAVGRLRSVCFSPDGTRAAVGSDTGHVVIWDLDV